MKKRRRTTTMLTRPTVNSLSVGTRRAGESCAGAPWSWRSAPCGTRWRPPTSTRCCPSSGDASTSSSTRTRAATRASTSAPCWSWPTSWTTRRSTRSVWTRSSATPARCWRAAPAWPSSATTACSTSYEPTTSDTRTRSWCTKQWWRGRGPWFAVSKAWRHYSRRGSRCGRWPVIWCITCAIWPCLDPRCYISSTKSPLLVSWPPMRWTTCSTTAVRSSRPVSGRREKRIRWNEKRQRWGGKNTSAGVCWLFWRCCWRLLSNIC